MSDIGGNVAARIQVKTESRNKIGEVELTWTDAITVMGWLDLQAGDSKYVNYNAKIQESTHVFLCNYTSLETLGITAENSRTVINGQTYDTMLIDDPMGRHEHLEIYLRYIGGQ